MGRYLSPGHEYVDGQTISGPSLTEHVSEALLKATAISEQTLKDPAALTDEVLINDNGTLKKETLQQIKALILSQVITIPIGAIVDFAGTDPPENWVFCFGQEVSRDTFSALFAVIGVTYGVGNGTSSFTLPDLRGRVAAGRDDMGGTPADRLHPAWEATLTGINGTILGSAGGHALNQLITAQLPSHAHTFSDYYQSTAIVQSVGPGPLESGNDYAVGETGAHTANSTTNTGSNQHHNNTQPTIILNKIIRYQ